MRSLLFLGWLASVGLAQAQNTPTMTSLSGALSSASRLLFERGQREEAAGDLGKAETAYQLLTAREPGFAPGWVGLGRVRERRGNTEAATEAYQRVPSEPEAVRAMARIREPEDPLAAAEAWALLSRLTPGDRGVWLELARSRALAGSLDDAQEALEHWLALEEGPPDGGVVLALARALAAEGRQEAVIEVLETYLARGGDGEAAVEARGRLDRISVERSARALLVGTGVVLPPEARASLDTALRQLAAGEHSGARTALEGLVQQHPRSAAVRVGLGEAHRVSGDLASAERAFSWATVLDPANPEGHLRLGLLLAEAYGGRRHTEARDSLARARTLQPGRSALAFAMAKVQQEMGAYQAAEASLVEGLTHAEADAERDAARKRLEALRRQPPEPQPAPEVAAPEVPEEVLLRYRVAVVYAERGQLDAARAELVAAMKLAPAWHALHNLDASLAVRSGDVEAAAAAWTQSLAVQPDQARVLLALGQLALQRGDRQAAQERFAQARELGAGAASYRLAVFAWEDGDPRTARAHLEAYFASITGGLDDAPARALQRQVERHLGWVRLASTGGTALACAIVIGVFLRRRRRKSLRELVEAAPELAHDVARILSALRHEVVKHNTTLLDEVAFALEQKDHHAVAFAANRLFGSAAEPGVLERLEEDLAGLRRLARRQGFVLDLEHRDPVLAPMLRAVHRLHRLESQLRQPWRARRTTPAALREISQALNREGHPALGRLLSEMGTTRLTRALLERVDTRVRHEAAFAGEPLAAASVEMAGEWMVRFFAGDLEDVLANLLRNARVAMRTVEQPRLKLIVAREEDPITGLEHVEIRVLDAAPGRLTTADIQGRALGRGLGLTADLVARHDGSLSVEHREEEAAAGFVKAVVVRLVRADLTPHPDGRASGNATPVVVEVEKRETP